MIKSVLITGANGMLGSSLCEFFQQKASVYALHRDSQCYPPCFKNYNIDLTDCSKLYSTFDQIKPDLVIHCAGLTNIEQCEEEPKMAYESNVTATLNIAKLCRKAKIIYISTDQVYGENLNNTEKNLNLDPINEYGKTKYLGEKKVMENCPDYIIIRTNIFGWNANPEKVSSAEWIYNSLKTNKTITLFTNYMFSPIYTEYLGEIISKLVNINYSGVINAGSPKPCSKYDFGLQLANEFNLDPSYIQKGSISDFNFKAKRSNNVSLNIRKIEKLGITIPDYMKSIKRFANYNRAKI